MKTFSGISWFDFQYQHFEKIRKEIDGQQKQYILNLNTDDYISYLIAKFTIDPLEVILSGEHYETPRKSIQNRKDMFGESYRVDVMIFRIYYPYIGDHNLFGVRPSSWVRISYDISIDTQRKQVSFEIELDQQDPQMFQDLKNRAYSAAFANVENINRDVGLLNQTVPGQVKHSFNEAKEKYLKEDNFFTAINLKRNPNTESVFSPPVIKKITIPQPKISANKEFNSVPSIASSIYDDILKVIYDAGKGMEKKPSMYIGKDEEALRDQFLFVLETRYEAITAAGETFNRGGKTDILLKYAPDGSNVFVAECKFWHGASEFQKAISQLFERYLTWRDSKVALILFVNNQNFSIILDTIASEATKHFLFKKAVGKRGESSFTYIFHLPQDREKEVYLEIMAFHYDKK